MIEPKQKSFKLLLVTVNYFSADLIAQLVSQLETLTLPDGLYFSMVCIDNSNSTKQRGELDAIERKASIKFDLIFNEENMGFGRAINKATEDYDFDFLCCVNPDVTLYSTTLFELLTHASKYPDQGIWGGITVDQNVVPDYRHAWQEPSIKNTLGWALGVKKVFKAPSWQDNYRHVKTDSHSPYSVDAVSGCCLLISAQAWQALDGFDDDFFLYSEEIDLCRRARSLGFRPTVVPKSNLQHAAHSEESSSGRLPIIYHSKVLYASKHHSWLYNLCYRSIIIIGSLARMIKYIAHSQPSFSRAWAKIALQSAWFKHNRFWQVGNE